MSKIKGIAFDKDGTLIDFEASWSKGLISLIESIFPNQTDKQQVLAEEIGFNLFLKNLLVDQSLLTVQLMMLLMFGKNIFLN